MKYKDESVENAILQKTVEFLQRYGVRGWNMAELAEHSGLAKNTLYRVIESKELLMERVTTDYYNKIYSRLTEILEAGGDYIDTCKKLISVYIDLSPAYFSEIFKEYPALEKRIANKYAAVRQRMIDYIKKGVDAGILREDLDAEKTFELMRSVCLMYDTKFSEQERAEKIHFAFECITYGILKK